MESKTNYTIVGLVVLILAAALLSAGLWLSVGFNQKVYTPYTVFIHESVAGLTTDAPVKFNGVQVGFVKQIKLNNNDPRQVELTLYIEENTPITTSTAATLISQGITGVTYVGLSASTPDLQPLQKMPDEPYPVIPAKPSLFNQLDTILKEVSENVNKIGEEAQHVFNEENALHIKNSLANLESFTNVIAKNNEQISRSLKSVDVFLKNTAKASNDFPQAMKELKVSLAKFNTLAADLSMAGRNVSKTMIAGKNTINQISHGAVPPTVSLLHKLNAISANIEQVSNELRQNPSVVIRGVAPPKPGPGE